MILFNYKKTTIAIWAGLCLSVMSLSSCSKKLDLASKGTVGEQQINTPDGAEGLVTAAYAQLGNDHYDQPFSLWIYGDVRGGDAYKGGSSTSDIQDFHFIETFAGTLVNFGEVDALWYNMYIGVSRANAALNSIESLTDAQYPLKQQRIAEMRYLRAHWYFQLKILFKYVPYIDENADRNFYDTISNRTLSNDALWEKIAEDFTFATNNLPQSKTEVGRPDKAAAFAYLAKTRLYQSYTQDEQNNVTGINTTDMQAVISATDSVLASSYHLESDFANNFLPGKYENGPEAIWSVQYSHDDGTMYGRLNWGDQLSVPQGLGCCDFKKPSQNLANAFKTDANGLPLLDTYNNSDVRPFADSVDPRMDHTIAFPNKNWKYNPALIYLDSWNRNPAVYGHNASLKENVDPNSGYVFQVGPFYPNAKNRIILRFADILLMRAEALIELGRQSEALPLINQLRARAAASTSMLVDANGNPEGKYYVKPYIDGVNISWTQANARKALRFERRLEMAEEGCRFFDLVRWGVAATEMNNFFAVEKTKWPFLNVGAFTKNKHEYLPIPQNQINFSKGLYKQNFGY
ncbi:MULTISPECIES: RagB/SusD family nutrient uptake outer membrane protein [Chitinophagaceae]